MATRVVVDQSVTMGLLKRSGAGFGGPAGSWWSAAEDVAELAVDEGPDDLGDLGGPGLRGGGGDRQDRCSVLVEGHIPSGVGVDADDHVRVAVEAPAGGVATAHDDDTGARSELGVQSDLVGGQGLQQVPGEGEHL